MREAPPPSVLGDVDDAVAQEAGRLTGGHLRIGVTRAATPGDTRAAGRLDGASLLAVLGYGNLVDLLDVVDISPGMAFDGRRVIAHTAAGSSFGVRRRYQSVGFLLRVGELGVTESGNRR